MKSTTEAIALRNHILSNFEDALVADSEEMSKIMNIVVVRVDQQGVELSGALAELKKNILHKDYPDMDFDSLNIFLLEGSDKVLGSMSEQSHKKGKEYLENLGVKVLLNALVDSYDGKAVTLKDGRSIRTRNLIWAAGVTGNLPKGFDKAIIQRGNRLKVNRFNQVEGFENVFCVGDLAYMESEKFLHGHSQVANVVIKQSKNLAANVMKKGMDRTEWKHFAYKDPGSMATIGKQLAVVDLPLISFQGRLAWFAWMFLPLMLILSVRNKLIIFINWVISYFTNDTTLRLILLPTRREFNQLVKENNKEEATVLN